MPFDDLFDWRDDCEDGLEFDLDPEDFETEEEYEEALEEAKYAWREDCEPDEELWIFPEEFETREDFEQAVELARLGEAVRNLQNDPAWPELFQPEPIPAEPEPEPEPEPVKSEPEPTSDGQDSGMTELPQEQEDISTAVEAIGQRPAANKAPAGPAERNGKGRSERNEWITVLLPVAVLLGAVIIAALWCFIYQYDDLRDALEACEQQAVDICTKYGLHDIKAEVIKEGWDTAYWRTCSVRVEASGVWELPIQQSYELFCELEKLKMEYIPPPRMEVILRLGGKEYRDDYTLYAQDGAVFVDESEAERRARRILDDSLSKKAVYVGLPEEYIDDTSWLWHQDMERPEGFETMPPQQRTTTYTWYYYDDIPKAQAIVGYWDEEKGEETEGYVREIINFPRPAPTAAPQTSYHSVYIAPSKPKATQRPADEYDVYSYSDPDDFYYDHPDDFFDYYDAEDYFYEHVG